MKSLIKLVFPVSSVDVDQVTLLAHRLASLGTLKERDVIFVYCWGDQWDVERPFDVLTKACRVVHKWILPDPPEGGRWPEAANHMFYSTAERLAEFHNKDPWMWFEGDCFPLKSDFLSQLETEYETAQKPYMGAINTSRYLKPDGEQFEQGRHMVGAGIYPADFTTRCGRIHFVPEKMPWDIWIEDEVVPDCHDTKLIFHAWNTGKYHLVDGELIGKDLANTTGNKHQYGGRPVNHEAALLHGVKDPSLFKLDLSQWKGNVA
jgi:hypothetical protein